MIGKMFVFCKLVDDKYVDIYHNLGKLTTNYTDLHYKIKSDEPCNRPMACLKWMTHFTSERIDVFKCSKGKVCQICLNTSLRFTHVVEEL